MQPARILVADVTSALPILEEALAGYNVVKVTRLAEAERMVSEDNIDLFVIGVHFDDSRATELIKTIRHDLGHQKTPIMVVRLLPGGHASLIRRSMEMMLKVRTFNEYLDLGGNLDAITRIREAAENYLPVDKLLSANQ